LIAAFIAEVGGARNTHLRANQSTREKSQDDQGDQYSEKPKSRIRMVVPLNLSGDGSRCHREGRRLQWLQAGAEGTEQEEAAAGAPSSSLFAPAASRPKPIDVKWRMPIDPKRYFNIEVAGIATIVLNRASTSTYSRPRIFPKSFSAE
jgi:hypothetical protein